MTGTNNRATARVTGAAGVGARAAGATDDAPVRPSAEIPDAIAEALRTPFDTLLTDPVRLRLQAALCGLPVDGSMGFTALRRALGLSDGNLGAHLAVLVEVGYAAALPELRGRRRITRYAATASGRAAFELHVAALRSVITAADPLLPS